MNAKTNLPTENFDAVSSCLDIVDESNLLKIEMEKLRFIFQEIQENYFQRLNPEKKGDAFGVRYEFDRYATFMDIANDILFKAFKRSEELSKLSNQYFDSLKAETQPNKLKAS